MLKEFENIWVTEPAPKIFEGLPRPKTTLAELYRRGWWVTEIFGSYATVVSESRYKGKLHQRYYFRCLQCLIDTSAITPEIQDKITQYNLRQWEKYKHLMLRPDKYGSKIQGNEV